MLALCAAYLVMCKVGPVMMRNRKPFELTVAMIVYNVTMVGLCSYLVVEVGNTARPPPPKRTGFL